MSVSLVREGHPRCDLRFVTRLGKNLVELWCSVVVQMCACVCVCASVVACVMQGLVQVWAQVCV